MVCFWNFPLNSFRDAVTGSVGNRGCKAGTVAMKLRQEQCWDVMRGTERAEGGLTQEHTEGRTGRKTGTTEAQAGAMCLQIKELQGRLGATGLEGAGDPPLGCRQPCYWISGSRV